MNSKKQKAWWSCFWIKLFFENIQVVHFLFSLSFHRICFPTNHHLLPFKRCFVVKLVNSWTRSGTKDFPLRAWRWQVSGRKNLIFTVEVVQTSHCLRFWKENPEVGEMIISGRIGLTIDYRHYFPGISLFSRLSRLVSTLSFALDAPENLRLTCLIFTIQHLGFFQEIIRQKPAKRTWFVI